MKGLLNYFFVFLGVIFFIILVIFGYLYFTNTFGIKSILTGDASSMSSKDASNVSTDRNPLLSETQEELLQKIGVDPAKLPSKITPEMIACFETKLGKERTAEIQNGASPTATDYFKAQSCF